MEQKRVALKSDYDRIEMAYWDMSIFCHFTLKSDYDRIEI